MTNSTPGILILAAGKGTRYLASGGSGNKLLSKQNAKVTVIETVIHQATLSGLPVALVTRPDAVAVRQHAEQAGVQVVLCDSHGSGESIAAGVAMTGDWQGWIITLGDMPWLTVQHYRQVMMALAQGVVQVRLTHRGQPGHPVGFDHTFADALRSLQGDEGARALLDATLLLTIEADAAVHRDIDVV